MPSKNLPVSTSSRTLSLLSAGVLAVMLLHGFASSARAQQASDEAGAPEPASGQPGYVTSRDSSLAVYLDCPRCDMSYIRTELTYVRYVRDPAEAEVHVFVTDLGTASGGTEYTIRFIGMRQFAGMDDEVRFVTREFDTEDDVRRGFVRILGLGLARYLAHTPLGPRLSLDYGGHPEPVPADDPWDSWLFNIGGNAYVGGEQTSRYFSGGSSLSAGRVTEDWKFHASASMNYNENVYHIDDTTTILNVRRSQNASAQLVRSISDHWSVGGFASASSSTYNNIALAASVAPAVEYDLFPYAESNDRQLRFVYRLSMSHARYDDTTIYDRLRETRFSQSLSATLEVKQPWGSVSGTVYASHYLHDVSKNDIGCNAGLSLRIFKGLSLDAWMSVSAVHDQLSIAKTDLSTSDILLARRQRETQYNYSASIGISYTFGSIYSAVVNPRFGGS